MESSVTFKPLGDSAMIVQLAEDVNPIVHQRIQSLCTLLMNEPFEGFIEAVPSYNSVTVFYEPYQVYRASSNESMTAFQKVSCAIRQLASAITDCDSSSHKLITIPVVYGGKLGPDLEYVAHYHQLTTDEVINIHTSQDYLVYMLGFAPGFPFLGGIDQRIATPRKKTPRQAISPGAVGIAGAQTGIYPLETPGGWQIIGQTPYNLFLPENSPPTLLQSGDKIRFKPITLDEYHTYREELR